MERKAADRLLKWKNKRNHKPFLITGVRKCGKTYLARKFGEENFEETAYFDLAEKEGIRAVFDRDLDADRILRELESGIYGKEIIPGKTLVILDGLQDCPRAALSLEHFRDSIPELHVIAIATRLENTLRRNGITLPRDKTEQLELYPMSFEEFVIANGGEHCICDIMQLTFDQEIPESCAELLEQYFRQYLITGGMPEAVQTWIETHDFGKVEEIQDKIVADIEADFRKDNTGVMAKKIRLIWNSIPAMLAKDNSKFIYSHIREGARAKDLEDALEWLIHAGIACRQHLVSSPQFPLSLSEDDAYFKVYLSDVGLLRKKANVNYRSILEQDAIYHLFRDALTENYVFTQLKEMEIKTWFWRTKADAEIGFLTESEGSVIPIEVRNADNTKAKSLHLFCDRFTPKAAFKISRKNIAVSTDGTTHVWQIPLYILFRLKGYILHEVGWPS